MEIVKATAGRDLDAMLLLWRWNACDYCCVVKSVRPDVRVIGVEAEDIRV